MALWVPWAWFWFVRAQAVEWTLPAIWLVEQRGMGLRYDGQTEICGAFLNLRQGVCLFTVCLLCSATNFFPLLLSHPLSFLFFNFLFLLLFISIHFFSLLLHFFFFPQVFPLFIEFLNLTPVVISIPPCHSSCFLLLLHPYFNLLAHNDNKSSSCSFFTESILSLISPASSSSMLSTLFSFYFVHKHTKSGTWHFWNVNKVLLFP